MNDNCLREEILDNDPREIIDEDYKFHVQWRISLIKSEVFVLLREEHKTLSHF